jgi:TRAP transporter TAXI family solute receptor
MLADLGVLPDPGPLAVARRSAMNPRNLTRALGPVRVIVAVVFAACLAAANGEAAQQGPPQNATDPPRLASVAPTTEAAKPAVLTPEAKRRLEALRDKVNEGTVGIVSGGIGGTYLRAATELAAVLNDDQEGLRILPIAGQGSLQNVWDIVFLRGVDVGLVQSDVLAYARREGLFPGIANFIQYIARLYEEEVHVLAARDISTLADLAGKKVNADVKGSGTSMTASVIFGELGIKVEWTGFDQTLALEKLRAGEIAALVYVAGKPARLFTDIDPGTGLHFLPLRGSPEMRNIYGTAALGADDYPKLVPAGQPVETLSVSAVLAAYAWEPDSLRFRKVERFVNAFFSRAAAFQNEARHPKWHEVNLAVPLAGWTRFPAAEKWLKTTAEASGEPRLREEFETFLRHVKPSGDVDPAERQILFAQYLQWRGVRGDVVASSEGTAGTAAAAAPAARRGAPAAAAETGRGERAGREPDGGATSALMLGPDTVRQIQAALHDQGLYDGPVDGVAGPETEVAVLSYQQQLGVPQTGFLDLETLRRLTSAGQRGEPAARRGEQVSSGVSNAKGAHDGVPRP